MGGWVGGGLGVVAARQLQQETQVPATVLGTEWRTRTKTGIQKRGRADRFQHPKGFSLESVHTLV